MKKLIRTASFMLAVAILASSGTAFADGERARPARTDNPFTKVIRCLQIVDLSEDQKTQIRAILESARPNLAAIAADLRADREALRSLLDAETPDECSIGAALLEVEGDAQALREETALVMDSIRTLLSPEQQAMLKGCLQAPRGASAQDEG